VDELAGVPPPGCTLVGRDAPAHAFRVAGTAQAIGRTEGCTPNEVEECRLAGLLHDCGKILLSANWPERALPVLTTSAADNAAVEQAEFGATSAEVGAYLVGLWGLPDPIVEAVAFHRTPSLASGRLFTPLTAAHVAHVFEMRDGPGVFDMRYLEEAGLTNRFPVWQTAHDDAGYERENV
jgi:HD-like signal output (HDOD) protein